MSDGYLGYLVKMEMVLVFPSRTRQEHGGSAGWCCMGVVVVGWWCQGRCCCSLETAVPLFHVLVGVGWRCGYSGDLAIP